MATFLMPFHCFFHSCGLAGGILYRIGMGWGSEWGGGGEKNISFGIRFSNFQIFIFPISVFSFSWKYFRKNMLVRYRGINNKGVPERPGTKWKVLMTISSTLKFQYFRKSWIRKDLTIRWDRKLETRGPFRCKICFRSILSRQNGLNCHMEQNILFLPKIWFFGFFPYWSAIGPLLSGIDGI